MGQSEALLRETAVDDGTAPCRHCGDRIPRARKNLQDRDRAKFCCEGCAAVYALLAEMKLDQEYYALKGNRRSPIKPEIETNEDFSALDEPPFRPTRGSSASLDFFLEGIHCTACVWILERLSDLSPGIEAARLDLGRSLLRVRVKASGTFEEAAKLILRLGYRPHPIRTEEEAEERLRLSDRATLRRIGISAFAAMNVMIYSISLYTGVDGRLGVLFRVLSLITALPALTYCAYPFYRNAWLALRSKRISIDLPIAFAFIGGYLESLRQTFLGTNLLYLDSLTSLVFLMLVSRYALSRLERAELSKSGLLQALLPGRVQRLLSYGGQLATERVRPQDLRVGDRVALTDGMRIPADGRIEKGEGYVDASFLTGESKPIRVVEGDSVFAGGRFLDGNAELLVVARGSSTRLGELQNRLEAIAPTKNARTERSDRWASLFLASVLGFTVFLFILYGREYPAEAFRRSLSLLIIACPCALALATPLTLAQAFRLAASRGIFLRDPDSLERVLEVKEVLFDKTGTLTKGEPCVREWRWSETSSRYDRAELVSIAYTLEAGAKHPYGRAIATYLQDSPEVALLPLAVAFARDGTGVSTQLAGRTFRIGRPLPGSGNEGRSVDDSSVEFSLDGERLAEIVLEDLPRREMKEVVDEIRDQGMQVRVLSGDSEIVVARVAREAGIPDWKGRLTPEGKKTEIDRLEQRGTRTLAIGDGVNDALALRAAHVGVAISRGSDASLESALSSANVALLRPSLEALPELFEIARRYRRTLLRNAIFSALYNLVGASVAVSGYVHPLVAAVAMPISALTVFFSTTIGLRGLPRKGGA